MIQAIEVFNEALAKFGASGILENPDINVNDELLLENYLQFEIRRSQHHVALFFIISSGDIRIDIDRTQEISEWTLIQIKKDKNEFLSFLTKLFSSYILVEYYGISRTRISFFNEEGECIDLFKYQEGISFRSERKDRLYFPVYSH